jgi:hypothetical protein
MNAHRTLGVTLAALAVAVSVHAQVTERLAFDVASITVNRSGMRDQPMARFLPGGRWTVTNLTDHVSFIGFVSGYTTRHPGTTTSTELLFLLDKIVQASYDCLITLLDIVPAADLTWTYRTNRDAYRLVEQIQRFHEKLIGSIYWQLGNRRAALDAWRAIAVDRSDTYAAAYTGLLAAIGADRNAADNGLRRQVDRALDAERGRWRDFSYTRLRRFGYRFDTY